MRGRALAITGCAIVVAAMLVVGLALVDKPHFGWLVTAQFPVGVSIAVIAGALLMLAGALTMPVRSRALIAWSIVALLSPAFGYLFLLPWTLLVVALPFVIAILRRR